MMACSAIDPCQISVDDFGKKSKNLKIYPNPTTGIVVIDFLEPAKQDVVIRITDMSGKLVYTENASTKNLRQHQIELGQLSAGVYIMSIDTNGKTSTYKVAVEK